MRFVAMSRFFDSLSFKKGKIMKKLVTVLMLVCLGLFVVGCENQKGSEAKEKLKKVGESMEKVGGELIEGGKEAAGAVKSGAESLIEAGKDSAKPNGESTPASEKK
ncbi:MAG: hypothetical protein IT427_08560 [Pirellulales bacterium]|nr:hypothetical protein [Pirellulales bacterium]